MPKYEYICKDKDCGHRFENEEKMNDNRLCICPVEDCTGELRLVWNKTPTHFKGTGWTPKKDNTKFTVEPVEGRF